MNEIKSKIIRFNFLLYSILISIRLNEHFYVNLEGFPIFISIPMFIFFIGLIYKLVLDNTKTIKEQMIDMYD